MELDPKQQDETLLQIRESIQRRQKPVRVLLVEDDENDAELTLKTLFEVDVNADWVRSKEDAVTFLDSNQPAMIFLDLKLGTAEKGLEVLVHVRRTKPDTDVVILTGVHQHHELECALALKHKAIAIMEKPLSIKQAHFIFKAP